MAEALMNSEGERELISSVEDGMGWITLNRPKALNALSLGMIKELHSLLKQWADDSNIRAVVVQGAGDKAFCAGGDVRAAYEAKQQGKLDLMEEFFRKEYTLNTLIHEYPKPYIAILDGIAMGGGLGVSLNSPYTVVTERSLMAMPETAIGFFPDVGATWFLSNTPDSVGVYWALTGSRFNGADALYGHLASYYVLSAQIPELLQALRSGDEVEDTLKIFHTPPAASPVQHLEAEIHEHFSLDSLDSVISSLQSSHTPFAKETLEILLKRSPTSLRVVFEQFKGIDPNAAFRDRIKREFCMSQKFMQEHDFFEGVRAVLVDKDHEPQWEPATLDDIKRQAVEAYFVPCGRGLEL